jgi:tetratricopeptide (TPR) repeat protein
MQFDEPPESFDENLVELLEAGIEQILEHEDPQQFLDWMVTVGVKEYFADEVPVPEAAATIGAAFGRHIWNAVPLPGNGFQPKPLPTPGRNDPCYCSSGLKFKHCCARLPEFPPIDPEEMWEIVVSHLSDDQIKRALASRRAPLGALAEIGQRFLDEDRAHDAVKLLAPLFAPGAPRLSEKHDPALDVLGDAYLALGEEEKREELLRNMTHCEVRILRANAWARLSLVYTDRQDPHAAWSAFREAQREDPDSPMLATLEVTILLAEQREAEAKERARFHWLRLSKRDDVSPEHVAYLAQLAQDPAGGMTDAALEAVSPEGKRLRAWAARLPERPVLAYEWADAAAPEPEDPAQARSTLARRLTLQGFPKEQIEDELDALLRRFERARKKAERRAKRQALQATQLTLALDEPEEMFEPGEYFLQRPDLGALESQWHDVFALGKPFSVQLEPFDEIDPWEDASDWLDFLEQNPQAGDSLDILDDLAAIIGLTTGSEVPWMDSVLLAPILERAEKIISAGPRPDRGLLPWPFPDNRAPLRLLVRLAYLRLRQSRHEDALRIILHMLDLNPDDNHGLRALAATRLLRAKDTTACLALCAKYPDDVDIALRYGKALAMFAEGRADAARDALNAALEANRHVARYLCEERLTAPKLDDRGYTFGRKDEAWLYRLDARDVWNATPGALEWLKREAAARGGSARKS